MPPGHRLDPDYFIGTPIAITEKLDGANVLLRQGEAYARSSNAGVLPPEGPAEAASRLSHGHSQDDSHPLATAGQPGPGIPEGGISSSVEE